MALNNVIYGLKDIVACEPFESRAPETKSVGTGAKRFEGIVSKELVVPLKVRFRSPELDLWPGDEVWLPHSNASAQWAKPFTITLDGKDVKVIFVPTSAIVLARRNRTEA